MQWHIIQYFISRWYINCRCISQLLRFPLLEFHETSRQRFKELKVTHLMWHPIHLVSLSLINYFPIYEVCICCRSSNTLNKYVPPTLPITHPLIWYIFHEKLICNIDWSHPKILHMNDIETMKFHVHSLLLNFTVDFILNGSPIDFLSHSWDNVRCICVTNTIFKHIRTYCVTLHNCHFYFYSHFVLFSLALHFLLKNLLCHTFSMCPRHTTQQFLSTYSALHNLKLLFKLSMYIWFHSVLRSFKIQITLSLATQR